MWVKLYKIIPARLIIQPNIPKCESVFYPTHVGGFSYIWSFVWYFRCADKTERIFSVHSYYMIRSMLCLGLWAWTKSESYKKVWAWSTAGCQPAVGSASTSYISFLKLQHICPDCHHWNSFFPWNKLLEWMFRYYSVPK